MRKRQQLKSLFLGSLSVLMLGACSKMDFGLPDENQSFSATVTYNNKVDLLIMIDNSSSMLQYQNKFASEVPQMISNLNRLGLDYHISVVTSDMRSGGSGGQFVGTPKVLTSSTPNLVSVLQSRVTQGQNGSDLERGLESIVAVLQPAYLQGAGSGFFRDDALLALMVLTNEDDYSADSTDGVIGFLDALKPPFKGTTKSWIMNFVGVVSIDGDCSTTADFKEAGLRYMSLANYSGGVKESICKSSLGAAVSNMKARIVEILSEYPLGRVPRLETLVVKVSGVAIAQDPVNGYTYHADTNVVRFHGTAQPGAYDKVEIYFTPKEGT